MMFQFKIAELGYGLRIEPHLEEGVLSIDSEGCCFINYKRSTIKRKNKDLNDGRKWTRQSRAPSPAKNIRNASSGPLNALLLNLPKEVRLMMLTFLPVRDVLNLRQCFKVLQNDATR